MKELNDDDFFAMCEDSTKKQLKVMTLIINKEFKELIPCLTSEELIQLENNLIKDGCMTPLVIWNNTLIDGHNRYSLCSKNKIEFKTIEMKFNNENEVKEWIILNQFGRRNLSPYTRAELAIKLNEVRLKDKAKENLILAGQVKKPLAISPKAQSENIDDLFEEVSSFKPKFTPVNTRKELSELSGIGLGSNKVENIDAISFLQSLDENSVSLVVTDPPFGIEYRPPRSVGNELFNDGKEETLELIDGVCKELKRVCKDNSHLYFFSGYTNLGKFQEIISKYFDLDPKPIIWVKNNHTMCDFSKHYANKYEFILFAKKGDKRLLNNKLSPDVLCFDKPTNKIHDCEKPVDLLKYLIENSSIKGEVVCDPFGGSLSTYRASLEVDRKCYTCEVNEDIYKKSINNLK